MARNVHTITHRDGTTSTRTSASREYVAAVVLTTSDRVWDNAADRAVRSAAGYRKQASHHAAAVARWDAGTQTIDDAGRYDWNKRTRADAQGYLDGATGDADLQDKLAALYAARDVDGLRALDAHVPVVGSQGALSWHLTVAAAYKAADAHRSTTGKYRSGRMQDSDAEVVVLDADTLTADQRPAAPATAATHHPAQLKALLLGGMVPADAADACGVDATVAARAVAQLSALGLMA